jgi:hypothetical protein
MDELMAAIRSLPKVQRAIIHSHLTDDIHDVMKVSEEFKTQTDVARATWLYSPSK